MCSGSLTCRIFRADQCGGTLVSRARLASWGLPSFCIFEVGRSEKSKINGTRGRMPPLKAFWRWPLGFQPPPDSTSLHSRSFTIVVGAAWRGVSVRGLGFWMQKLLASITPTFLESGVFLINNEQKIKYLASKTIAGQVPRSHCVCQTAPQTLSSS